MAYQTVSNLLEQLPRTHRPTLPPLATISRDADVIASLQAAYRSVIADIEREKAGRQAIDKTAAIQFKAYKDRRLKRQQDLAGLNAALEQMQKDTGHAPVQSSKSFVDEDTQEELLRKNSELNVKLQRFQRREVEIRNAIETLENEDLQDEVLIDSDENKESVDNMEDVKEEIELIREANENLRSRRDELKLKEAEYQWYNEEIIQKKGKIGEEKGVLGQKCRQMQKQLKEKDTEYWNLLSRRKLLDDHFADVNKQIELLRDENRFLQDETENLKILEKNLDEQEKINAMLQDKLQMVYGQVPDEYAAASDDRGSSAIQHVPYTNPIKKSYVGKIVPTSKSSTVIKKNHQKIIQLEQKEKSLRQITETVNSGTYGHMNTSQGTPESRSIVFKLKSLD